MGQARVQDPFGGDVTKPRYRYYASEHTTFPCGGYTLRMYFDGCVGTGSDVSLTTGQANNRADIAHRISDG